MDEIKFDEFQEAVEIFEIYTKIGKKDLRERYLKLSKIYHPDAPDGGNKDKFQKLSRAYKILKIYVENFRFEFSDEEFKKQFPMSGFYEKFWY